MSDAEVSAANILAPQVGSIAVVATSVAVVSLDLTTRAELAEAFASGKFITFCADGGDVYVAFSNAAAAIVIDPTAVTGNTQCYLLPQGQERPLRFRNGYHFMKYRSAAGTPTLRMYVSSFVAGGTV